MNVLIAFFRQWIAFSRSSCDLPLARSFFLTPAMLSMIVMEKA